MSKYRNSAAGQHILASQLHNHLSLQVASQSGRPINARMATAGDRITLEIDTTLTERELTLLAGWSQEEADIIRAAQVGNAS